MPAKADVGKLRLLKRTALQNMVYELSSILLRFLHGHAWAH